MQYLDECPSEEFCALCLIDMDDFRKINSKYGYQAGDRVLEKFLDALTEISNAKDILVRFGSDEFILFLADTTVDDTNKRINDLYRLLRDISEELGIEVECSIGIAGTDCARHYIELYQCADKTLQHIKKYGKNNVAWYVKFAEETKTEDTRTNDAEIMDTSKIPTSVGGKERDLISFAFDVCERVKDIEKGLEIIIERIGKEYKLDSVKLVIMSEEAMTTTVTLSWYKDPSMDQPQKVDYVQSKEDMENFLSLFNEDGSFSDRDIENKDLTPEIKAIFARAYKKKYLNQGIFEGGIYKGCIIYECDDPNYVFTDEMIRTLKALSKILAINLLKLRSDNANEAKMTFISKMSHDIRTPMNAIIGMTNIAMNVADDKEKLMECLKKIDSSTKYLLSLVNDVLDISKIESGKITINEEPMNLLEVINDMENLFTMQADEKHINYKVNIDIKDTYLIGDVTKLNQVIMNLIGNAIKFTPDWGDVTFTVKQILQETDTAKYHFSVKDTGIGISTKSLHKIFDAFEQANSDIVNKYGGSGLGLSISSNLVRFMGGILKVDSVEGEGAEFYFDLAFKINPDPDVEEEENISEVKEEKDDFNFEGKTVLLVEDNELNAEIATELLERVGFNVETAQDGKKAVMKFAEMEPFHYDVILMDIRMPVMNGLDATNYIRNMGKKDSQTVPIYAMTANAFDDDMKKSIQNGMNGHLSKPIDVQKLYKTLRKQLKN
jgi:diguanylate cyclase (GGDEF)-like protein